ncbi:hypothetical protein CY34DRAFT_184676 [Suillus luteus UH-Slu-Lm8-n1]|uniref:Uncharacterized protein n=1 Tax=Suillus luteus UH-Slu-Lm8-n1 TaxID=930992 RepID=A0A0D0B5L2_9AGAM|nr:hypothetical protein CY34DRAFT_184676 [Suillus luteus UH-Slu-Lm8-n1]
MHMDAYIGQANLVVLVTPRCGIIVSAQTFPGAHKGLSNLLNAIVDIILSGSLLEVMVTVIDQRAPGSALLTTGYHHVDRRNMRS